jgi:diguanylate cyclase (GGDEF)-like protein
MDEADGRDSSLDVREERAPYDTPLSLDMVSAFAGDRPLTDNEKDAVAELQTSRKEGFYSDLLYAITHRFFPGETARELWERILKHKYEMSSTLNRNVRITVASIDYLSNLTAELPSPTASDEKFMTELIRLSAHDGLTGLLNHSSCYQKIDAEIKRYARYKTPVSILMMDFDNFKAINDSSGHQAGDGVLRAVGAVLREEARDPDICCRYGGDEFVVILPLTESREASILADRLKARIEQSSFDGKTVTVSIGIASSGQHVDSSRDLVRLADSALYQAKRGGKNRVAVGGAQKEETAA